MLRTFHVTGVPGHMRADHCRKKTSTRGVRWQSWQSCHASRVRWSGFGRSRFGRLFAFLGPRQSRDSCRSRGLALLEKFVRSRHKPTWSRPPGKFAALPWCCRSVTPSGGNTRVPIHWFSRPTQPLLTAEPMHPPAHSPTAFGGRCRAARSSVQTSAPVPVPVSVFALGSG